ncbi:RidA family protein [Plantibacter sp. MMLR14_011]|uniref:RidA family protein n=1 Tax=Plantibacter sp. MMLR14_011 TaxID=1898746 RepID=UPI0009F2FA64|nr:RidA family protein [Plantibacter sp. MMLR14_011]
MTDGASRDAGIRPAGAYSVARLVGELVHTAGMTPRVDGALVATGRIGRELDDAQALSATRIATERALAAAANAVPEGAFLTEVVSLTVYLAVADGFVRLSEIADAASAVVVERFPDASLPVRAALGVAALPGDAPVEIQLVARCTGGPIT